MPSLLRRLAVLVAVTATIAVACSSSQDELPAWNPYPPADYGVAPKAVDASTFETMTPIKHVVFVIKENRTFDMMFGRFPGANGVSVGLDQGQARPLTRGLDAIPTDIKHCYECSLQ